MSKQLDMFKTNLEEFASKHKQEIRKNPEFRVQFQDMCATIGVDPLACKPSSVVVPRSLGVEGTEARLVTLLVLGLCAEGPTWKSRAHCLQGVPGRDCG